MNDQNQSKAAIFRPYLDKIKAFIYPFWLKFKQSKIYTNKKIFYPFVGVFSLLFLTILIGLIFGGNKTPTAIKIRPTPTPLIIQATQAPAPEGSALSQIEQRLLNLKKEIEELDVKQSRLQPPTVDFKISF